MTRTSASNRSQLALQDYLDALLVEATGEGVAPTPTAKEPAPAPAATRPEGFKAKPVAQLDETDTLSDFEAAVLEEQIRDASRQPERAKPVLRSVQFAEERSLSMLNSRLLDDVELKAAQPLPQVEPPVLKAPAPAMPETPPVVAAPKVEYKPEPAPVLEAAPPKPSKARRDWAEDPFECLLFEVGKLTLAVPLVSLGSIYPLSTELTPLFGQPKWFMGILPSQVGNLKVVNTGLWVMPERYDESLKDSYSYVISIEGYDWGLAVTNVRESIRLDPSEVKWRSDNGQRPWLAGTVIAHMCALVDVSELAGLIASGASQGGAQQSSRL
ncbi:CheW domain-containing protein [Atopomonas sediminilitoris]|uniref:CheW domain-containing protein n=1 Tax=Atopomonas sediminilitoris TaxID=2919919 RepID=UPI001F4E5AA5|nr:CheW domain-containing protein [Atopomonas sediminilitoris]MCJ8167924.1 chemotaxis protein CheW [Atopomonas sediminilitoris]